MLATAAAVFLAILWPSQVQSNTPGFHQLTMEEATNYALAAKPGSVIGSAFVRGQKRLKYVFEIESGSSLWRVKVDANTGEVYRACRLDSVGRNACPTEHRRPVGHVKVPQPGLSLRK